MSKTVSNQCWQYWRNFLSPKVNRGPSSSSSSSYHNNPESETHRIFGLASDRPSTSKGHHQYGQKADSRSRPESNHVAQYENNHQAVVYAGHHARRQHEGGANLVDGNSPEVGRQAGTNSSKTLFPQLSVPLINTHHFL